MGNTRKKILLTGGAGFIGRNILDSSLASEYEIIAPKSCELNLIDTECTDLFFSRNSFDVVIHSACKPGHRNSKDHTNLTYVNLRMFYNLLRQQKKFGKLLNIGSGAVYNQAQWIIDAKETDALQFLPEDEHGFCKYIQNFQMANYDNLYDLRVFGIFGKYEDYAIRFISNAICKSLCGLPITLNQNRNFSYLYIDDFMPILKEFIEQTPKHPAYNIVPDEKVELLYLAELVKEICCNDKDIVVKNNGYAPEYTGNNTRLKDEFVNIGFTKIKQAVTLLYNYYKGASQDIDRTRLLGDR